MPLAAILTVPHSGQLISFFSFCFYKESYPEVALVSSSVDWTSVDPFISF